MIDNLNSTSENISNSSVSSSSPSDTTLSSKTELLRRLPFAFTDPQSSILLTPDRIFDILDFGPCPTIDSLIQRTYMNNDFLIRRRDSRDFVINQNTTLYTTPTGLQHDYREAQYFRKLKPHEQQVRLEMLQTQAMNNPSSIVNRTFHTRVQRLAVFFQNQVPSTDITTYHHQLLLKASFADVANTGPIPANNQRDIAYIGLDTLIQNVTTAPNFLDPFYPLLWDEWQANDINDFQYFIDNAINAIRRIGDINCHLLLVLVAPQAIAAPYTQVNHGNAPVNVPPGSAFITRILSFMNLEDRKMASIGCRTSVMYNGNVQYVDVFLPHYDFFNHILDWAANNLYPTAWASTLGGAYVDGTVICQYMFLIQTVLENRIQDYLSTSLYTISLDQQALVKYIFFNVQLTPNLQIQQIRPYLFCPYEIMTIMFDVPLLSPIYDPYEFVTIRGRTGSLDVIQMRSEGGRAYFYPSTTTIQNPFAQPTPLPALNDTYAVVNYPLVVSVFTTSAGHQVWPLMAHLCSPLVIGYQSKHLEFKNYFAIHTLGGIAMDVSNQLSLPNGKEILLRDANLEGISFLIP